MEKDLRKNQDLSGTWVRLGNGEEWCVPAMPLSRKRKRIMAGLRAIANIEKKMEARQASEEDVSPEENIEVMEEFMDHAFSMAVALLQCNYPSLTAEMAEEHDLFDVSHAYRFITIAKGESEIAPLLAGIEAARGEAKKEGDQRGEESRAV